jgi:hypothetical protein
MITRKQYTARGVDVTRIPTEQLIADGYIAPLNELPTIIDGPGDYITRDGRRVTIHTIEPTKTLATTGFHAKGHIWRRVDSIGRHPQYDTWHISGHYWTYGDLALDIVGEWRT